MQQPYAIVLGLRQNREVQTRPDSHRSTTGFTLMLNGADVAWKSNRQSVVALSSAEAEFIAASALVQEVIYT